jgi:hypothetical protein
MDKEPQFQQEKFQTFDSLSFREVFTPAEAVIELPIISDDSEEVIQKKLKEKVMREHWWLQDFWQKQGQPKEQFTINSGNSETIFYNFDNELTKDEIIEVKNAFEIFTKLKKEVSFTFPKYILVSNITEINSQSQESFFGKNESEMNAVVLYPRAVSIEPYRIKEVSSLKGTIVHEFGHIILKNNRLGRSNDIMSLWHKRFGWDERDSKTLERCITEYAKVDSQEDFCESLVGYHAGSENLDTEKKEFTSMLFDATARQTVSFDKDKKVIIPRLANTITYSRQVSPRITLTKTK